MPTFDDRNKNRTHDTMEPLGPRTEPGPAKIEGPESSDNNGKEKEQNLEELQAPKEFSRDELLREIQQEKELQPEQSSAEKLEQSDRQSSSYEDFLKSAEEEINQLKQQEQQQEQTQQHELEHER